MPSPPASRSARKSSPRRRSKPLILLLVGVILALLFSGFVYLWLLDRDVQARFEGHRWSLPARVFARPLELYVGRPLTLDLLQHELEALNFRVGDPGPGRFRIEGDSVVLTTRGFVFSDGPEPPRSVRLRIQNDRVTQLQDRRSGEALDAVRLEPLLIGSLYPQHGEDRVLVRLEEVPRALIATLLVVEDRRFFMHRGVDPWSIVRAAWSNLRAGRTVQGGSTLTQQLVRNLYLSREQTLARKLQEALLAIVLEYRYPKTEILEAYLNEIFLGQAGGRAIHGFALASEFYFQRPLAELSAGEIALLVGLARGASHYDPRRFPNRALERRNLILQLAQREGILAADRAQAALARPLEVVARPVLPTEAFPAFLAMVQRELRQQYDDADLRSEGLRIFTTLDPGVQLLLEQRVLASLHALESRRRDLSTVELAAVVTDPRSGEVRAILGGRDPRFAGFNRAVEAKRPVGSLLKPFIIMAAVGDPASYTLATLVADSPLSLRQPNGEIWAPQNFDRRFRGTVTLWETLVHSLNVPTVRVALEIGIPRVVRVLETLGLERSVAVLPSLALGAIDLSPLEVAGLYQALANGGYATRTRVIREVLDADNRPLHQFPVVVEGAVPEGPVHVLLDAMHASTQSGTARQIGTELPDRRFAGKTGTSNDLRDSWFVGFDDRHLAVVWVGRDDNQPIGVTGATGALPLWIALMRGLPAGNWTMLEHPEIQRAEVDLDSGLRVLTTACPRRIELSFWRDSVPRQRPSCDLAP
jgi:penicillin-binding protein 1B